MAFGGAPRRLRSQCTGGVLQARAPAPQRGRQGVRAARLAGKKHPSALHPGVLCQCEALHWAGQNERSPSPTRWHEQQPPRSSPPEPCTPSTSGRELPPHPSLGKSQRLPKVARDALGFEEAWDGQDDGYTPFPANLPTDPGSEGLPSHDLFKNSLRYFGVQEDGERWRCLSQVWVLLFGVGTRETEGIYSLRAVSRDTGMPQDTIIAFEEAEDAQRYAGLLEATMDHVPHVSPINVQELLDFCQDAGYKCRLEPRGTLLYPPDYNIGMTDWERSLRLREGRFEVLDSEPEPSAPGPDSPLTPMSFCEDDGAPPLHNNAGVGPPAADIEDARARLERQWR